jgi:hypothetical protein
MSWWMSWDALTAISTAILAVGVPGTIWQSGRADRREERNERYLHYIERYQNIIVHLPYNIFAVNGPDTVTPEQKPWLVAYIDLCTEELEDRKTGAIDEETFVGWGRLIYDDFVRCKHLMALLKEFDGDYPSIPTFLEEEKKRREGAERRRNAKG